MLRIAPYVLALAVWLMAAPTEAVTFDAGTGSSSSGSTTDSHSHTTAVGATVMLLGITNATNSGQTVGTISSVTYNSVSASALLDTTSASGAIRQAVYCLDNPSSGANTASVTTTSASGGNITLSLSVMTFTGSGTCAQITNISSANGSGTTLSVTLSGVNASSLLGDVACHGTEFTVGANQTNRASANGSVNSCQSRGVSTQSGADGGVMSWTSSTSDSWHITAYEVPDGGIPTITGCLLLQDGASKFLAQNGTDGVLLQGGASGACISGGGGATVIPARMLLGVGL